MNMPGESNKETTELIETTSIGNGNQEQQRNTVGVDDILNRIGCGSFQVIAYLLAALSFFAFSARNYLTFAFVNLQVSRDWHLNGVEAAAMPAASSTGVLVGGMLVGFMSDRFGRVWPYALFAFLLGTSVLASAFSPNFYVFVIIRAVVAIGMGGTQLLVHPTLLEFLPIKNRGQVAILVLLNQSIGSSLAALLAWILISNFTVNGWRMYVIATSIPCLLLAVYRLAFYCESPRYLVSKGKIEKAWKIFAIMAKMNRKNLDDIASMDDFRYETSQNSRTYTLEKILKVWKPPLLLHTLCLLVITSTQRMFIFSRTLMFLSVLLHNLGVNPYLGLVISSVSQIPGVLLMSIITEWPWFGRLNTFRIFTLMAAVSYFLFATVQTEITIPVFTVFIFFSIAPMTSMVYTYGSESYPTEIRATAVGFLNTAAGLLGICTAFIAGYMADLSKKFPWLFPGVMGLTCVMMFLVSLGLRREMSGKRLQDSVS